MNKFRILGFVFLASVSFVNAQDAINKARKEIDAEKFQDAKNTLKSIIKTDPTEGEAFFLLGNVYLYQNVIDSAKSSFEKGLTAKNHANYNNIGLGQMDLNAGNLVAAKTKFTTVLNDKRKKDFYEYVYIARAYMKAEKPDYKAALATLNLAKEKNGEEPQVYLAFGDAHFGDKNQNDAYSAYRNAFQADNSLIRAKMQLGVLLKGAKAYTEAVAAYQGVVSTNPTYGPVYRELAETYYYWGLNVPGRQEQYFKQALGYYEKYLSLTDYSLDSRMRHADFLILTKDYKSLEEEANKMKELDKVNPRILRYLGYSAYQNKNYDVAIKSLESFITGANNKVISLDQLYLGLATIKKGIAADGITVDASLFDKGIANINKAVEMEISVTEELSQVGKEFYEKKLYKETAKILEIATANKESKGYLYDNYYLGNAIYFDNTKPGIVKDTVALKKADIAFGNVITASPDTQDVYLSRARTNSLLEDDEAMIKYYQQYIDIVTKKGEAETTKPNVKAKLIECYNSIAAGYANTDKEKAKEFFAKTLAIEPENTYATQSLKLLK